MFKYSSKFNSFILASSRQLRREKSKKNISRFFR